MAKTPFLFSFFLFSYFFFFFFPASSRQFSNLPNSNISTTILDVSSSLKLAREILTVDPKTLKPFGELEQQTLPTNLSSSFSLLLQPREALHLSKDEDYASLVLSRLTRDSARVDHVNLKLELAINNLKKSDLKPVETEIMPEDLATPIVSGQSHGSGEYFSRLGVGRPAKQYYMVIDTGSDINWLQCEPCSECYQQDDQIFNPSTSSSYTSLTCNSPQCGNLDVSGCRDGKCLYQVSYGDGSYTVGDLATETLTFGNTGSVNNVALGCGHDNEGLFVGAAGLLGLGGGPLSLTSQIKASRFSYCLVNRDSAGSSTLEFNSAEEAGSITAPLLRNSKTSTFYYIGLTGMSVGGKPLSISPEIFSIDEAAGTGGVIVDSGTAITRLQTQLYDSLRDSFKDATRALPSAEGVALFDTCYDLSSRTSVRVPTVSFEFSGGKSLQLPAKNYLIPVDASGTFCFAFAPTTSSLSIIGNVQQQGTRVSYDLVNNRVGFSPNKC
ncbi:hypothetical protein UlMin_008512 [Ulmus minor]